MPDKNRNALTPPLDAFAADFQLSEGRVAMPSKRLIEWRDRLVSPGAIDMDKAVTEILALAHKFKREGGAAAGDAIAQLCAMAAVLLAKQGVHRSADELMQDSGLRKKTEKVLGVLGASVTAPTDENKTTGAAGMLSFLGNKES